MLLEKGGKASSTKRTRHWDIRYFFIKDRVDNKEVEIVHKPTEDLKVDFMAKQLQGKLFIKFRDLILGMNPE